LTIELRNKVPLSPKQAYLFEINPKKVKKSSSFTDFNSVYSYCRS